MQWLTRWVHRNLPRCFAPRNVKWTSFAPPGWTNFAPPLTSSPSQTNYRRRDRPRTRAIGVHLDVAQAVPLLEQPRDVVEGWRIRDKTLPHITINKHFRHIRRQVDLEQECHVAGSGFGEILHLDPNLSIFPIAHDIALGADQWRLDVGRSDRAIADLAYPLWAVMAVPAKNTDKSINDRNRIFCISASPFLIGFHCGQALPHRHFLSKTGTNAK